MNSRVEVEVTRDEIDDLVEREVKLPVRVKLNKRDENALARPVGAGPISDASGQAPKN
jgi:hypothetical protein